MVHPTLHQQGLGTILLLARLEALRLSPDIKQVVLDTSQHTQAFFARFGFVVKQVVPEATVLAWTGGIWHWICDMSRKAWTYQLGLLSSDPFHKPKRYFCGMIHAAAQSIHNHL
ncbi:hypothetical protein [Xanthomonas axonopodis]